MIRRSILFHGVLIPALTVFYVFHKNVFYHEILLNVYLMNAMAAILVFNLVYFFRKTHREYIGYYFLFGTALKFFLYFVFVLPVFKLDGQQSREEFFGFFIPYFLALVVETIALISLLNNSHNDNV